MCLALIRLITFKKFIRRLNPPLTSEYLTFWSQIWFGSWLSSIIKTFHLLRIKPQPVSKHFGCNCLVEIYHHFLLTHVMLNHIIDLHSSFSVTIVLVFNSIFIVKVFLNYTLLINFELFIWCQKTFIFWSKFLRRKDVFGGASCLTFFLCSSKSLCQYQIQNICTYCYFMIHIVLI